MEIPKKKKKKGKCDIKTEFLAYREKGDLLEVHKHEKPWVMSLLFAQFTQTG